MPADRYRRTDGRTDAAMSQLPTQLPPRSFVTAARPTERAKWQNECYTCLFIARAATSIRSLAVYKTPAKNSPAPGKRPPGREGVGRASFPSFNAQLTTLEFLRPHIRPTPIHNRFISALRAIHPAHALADRSSRPICPRHANP